jgi:hypothetical protein
MDDPARVGRLHPVGNRGTEIAQLRFGDRAATEAGGERLALDELHHEVARRRVVTDLEHAHDVRMADVAHPHRFGHEVDTGRRLHQLDRDLVTALAVLRGVHLARATTAE